MRATPRTYIRACTVCGEVVEDGESVVVVESASVSPRKTSDLLNRRPDRRRKANRHVEGFIHSACYARMYRAVRHELYEERNAAALKALSEEKG